MGEKKAVSRKVALGVGLSCLLLIIVIGGIVANYTSALKAKDAQLTSAQNQIGTLKSQNANLQSQALSENSTINSDNSTINSMKTEISTLQTQVTSENSSLARLQNQLSGYQSELTADNSEINAFNVTSVESQIASENSNIDLLNQQVSNLQNKISSLETSPPSIDGFSIIQITDTQYLSDADPSLFDGLTSWIVNSSSALNLAMVIHTGDIVQDATSTDDWTNANNALMQLYNNGVPYCWDAGNHDQLGAGIGLGNPDSPWLGGNYPALNVTIMRQQPYWVGDISDGKDTAVKFNYGNYHFMVINIEYDANQTVLDWMQTLLQCNPNVNVIVATHNFLNGYGGYGYTSNPADVAWATNFETLLNNYPNVFMTLNGHDIGDGATAYNKMVGNREEIFFNMQELNDQQSAAIARIYTFNMTNPANPVVNVYTYQTYGTPEYLTDSADQFSFSANLNSYSASTVNVAANTAFLGASDNSVSFANSITLNSFSQYGDALTFNNLTLNGVTSNFTVTALGADVSINNFDLNTNISYTVDGVGNQTFSLNEQPTSVYVDGTQTLTRNGWSYENGEIVVSGAASSVIMNFS